VARRISRGDIHGRLRASLRTREPRLVRILGSLRGDLRNAYSYAEIGRALQSGNLSEEALAQWRQDYSAFVQNRLRPEWDRQIEAAGKATAGDVSRFAEQPFQFQPTGARVVEWIETRGAERVVSWTQLQHEAAQSIIRQAINEGVGADELGIRLRAVTGLTPRQAEAVEKMRTALVTDGGMDATSAGKQAQRYADMLHRQRALRISRTELASAYNQGQDAAIRQAIGEGMFDGPVTRFWSTADDERVCFPAGTLIATPNGDAPIESITAGMEVITPAGAKTVTRTISREYRGEWIAVNTPAGGFVCTANHPVWVNGDWLCADRILPGDCLKTSADEPVGVSAVLKVGVGDTDNRPAICGKGAVTAGVLRFIGVPVDSIGLDDNPDARKCEVGGIGGDLLLSEEGNTDAVQGFSYRLLKTALTAVSPVTSAATEDAVIGRPCAELLATCATLLDNRGTSALLRTEVTGQPLLCSEDLAAPLTGDILGMSQTAGAGADSIAVGDGSGHTEDLPADRAELLGLVAPVGLVTSAATEQAGVVSRGHEDLAADRTGAFMVNTGSGMIAVSRTELAFALDALGASELLAASVTGIGNHGLSLLSTLYQITQAQSTIVYNLSVQDEACYYANGLLVHNCEICGPMDGTVISIDGQFDISGGIDVPPAHVSCRCICGYEVQS
jgi:hypothetical protein